MSDKSMGEIISSLREEKGLTQKELGAKIGVGERTIFKWEKNISLPDISTIPKIAEALEVSIEEIMKSKPLSLSNKVNYIIDIVLRGVPVAMGIAIIVASVFKEIDIDSGFMMTGIAVLSMGIYFLKNE